MAPDAEEKKPRRSPKSKRPTKPKRPRAAKSSPERSAGPRGSASGPRGARPGLGRLRPGEAISLVAAVLLFILMFFDWFGIKAVSSAEQAGGLVSGSGGGSAWDALEVIPLFLMLAIVVAVGAALLKLASSEVEARDPGRHRGLPSRPACGAADPDPDHLAARAPTEPSPNSPSTRLLKLPIFLALAAALGIAYGGWRTMGEEGTTFGGIAKRLESPSRGAGRARR